MRMHTSEYEHSIAQIDNFFRLVSVCQRTLIFCTCPYSGPRSYSSAGPAYDENESSRSTEEGIALAGYKK